MIDVHQDPLRDVRAARRWALGGILAAACLLMPVYGLTLGLPILQLALVLGPTTVAALIGIEFVTKWEFRMRRRYAYPHHLSYELAAIHEFPRACQRSAQLVGQWLRADSVVVAWLLDN